MNMKVLMKSYVVIFLLSLIGLNGCSEDESNNLSGSGILEAKEVLISAKLAGTIIDLPVHEGDIVQEVEVIAQIDTEKIYLQKKQLLAGLNELKLTIQNAQRGVDLAKDNMDNMKKKYNRIKSLLNENSVTQQQYDDIETAYKAAQSEYDNAITSLKALRAKEEQVIIQIELSEIQMQDAKITAPIHGTVIEKYVEQGEIARPGGSVVSLADLQNMWIKIYFKETELGKIKLNGNAELQINSYPHRTFPGRISWISPKAEFTPKNVQTKDARADLVYAVKIEVENSEGILKIGMPADVILK
jgi:HlyD family secretion protein